MDEYNFILQSTMRALGIKYKLVTNKANQVISGYQDIVPVYICQTPHKTPGLL